MLAQDTEVGSYVILFIFMWCRGQVTFEPDCKLYGSSDTSGDKTTFAGSVRCLVSSVRRRRFPTEREASGFVDQFCFC